MLNSHPGIPITADRLWKAEMRISSPPNSAKSSFAHGLHCVEGEADKNKSLVVYMRRLFPANSTQNYIIIKFISPLCSETSVLVLSGRNVDSKVSGRHLKAQRLTDKQKTDALRDMPVIIFLLISL